MYQALYRKYRPQTFDDVIGQSHITESLKKQVETGRLSHAYIFIGTRGTGKTTCARILAKAINCQNQIDGNPCGVCESCRGISDGSIMDIVELDAASNNGVDNVRALREEAVFSPVSVKKRVYIIDEVHMLSTAAFNALLKILEEPPEHLVFILATTELQKVPATILSRCQRHSFRRVDIDVLSQYLLSIAEKENLKLTADAASLLAGLSEGSVRDALSMLDQCSVYDPIDVEEVYSAVGLAGNKRIVSLLSSILEKDYESSLQQLDSMWRDGKDIVTIFKELSSLLRDTLVLRMAPKNARKLIYGGYQFDEVKKISDSNEVSHLIFVLNELQNSIEKMKDLPPKMSAELCIMKLCLGNEKSAEIQDRNISYVGKSAVHDKKTLDDAPPWEEKEPKHDTDGVKESVVEYNTVDAYPESTNVVHDEKVINPVNDDWGKISDIIRDRLPHEMRGALSGIGATFNDNILILELDNDFLIKRFERTDITNIIEEASSNITGKNIRVKFSLKQGDKTEFQPRSLDELKKFDEINWR